MTRWFRIALGVYSIFLSTIGTLAYIGRLPGILVIVPHHDTLGHVVLIGTFSLLLDGSLSFRPLPVLNWWPVGLGPVLVLVAAGAEELLQALSANRSSTLSDFAADLAGIFFFALLARILTWRKRREVRQRAAL